MSKSIWTAIISLLLILTASPVSAQKKFFSVQKDSVPMFRGFAVSLDMVGAGMLMFGDRGQLEGALRVNLHDEWFPVVELGYGKADSNDEVTEIRYKTKAPYFKLGIDKNMLKQKHGPNRLYIGLRYAFTNYKVDITRPRLTDPNWHWDSNYTIEGESCNMHWVEALVGLDAKIWGPLHLGWNVRYKLRVSHKEGDFGQTWYVPGFGTNDSGRLDATFNLIIDI